MTSTTTTPQRGVLASFAFLLISMLSAQALAFDVGGLRYTVTSGTTVSVVWILLRSNPNKDLVIPATASDGTTTYSVTTIGGYGFYFKALTSVTIPDSVTTIGESAFYGNALTRVIIPDSVTTIETGAFGVNALTSVTIPDSVTTIGNFAFYNNVLTSVIIPDSVEAIGLGAVGLNALISAVFEGNFGGFELDMFEYNADLATIIYAQGASGWDAPLRVFMPDTGPTGSVTAQAAVPAATPVPTGPLWLLGIMAGLLSLVGISKLRKA